MIKTDFTQGLALGFLAFPILLIVIGMTAKFLS